jgi:ribonucleoside-diphosphate reductase alpha chain
MSERLRLPLRRACESFDLEVASQHFTVTVGRYADGTIGEIFLQAHKPGSQSDANARDAAVAASLALQFGCPLETLRHALLRDSRGQPSTPLGAAIDELQAMERER